MTIKMLILLIALISYFAGLASFGLWLKLTIAMDNVGRKKDKDGNRI